VSYLNLNAWARRETFDYFRTFDKPFFNVCVRLDVAPLRAALARHGGCGLGLACYFVALRTANAHPPLRWRIEGERVRVHETVHGSTTVLRDDGDSFGFADLEYSPHFDHFVAAATTAIEAARSLRAPLDPKPDDTARIHFTTLPWLHFTSFSHARNWGREDSVPKLAFGRAEADGARLWLPLSVEVHHALMDGLHVGRFVQDVEAALREPAAWLPARA
jgi:chloramphenicol O-acetyltransferase type A